MTNKEIISAIEKRIREADPAWDFAPVLREAVEMLKAADDLDREKKYEYRIEYLKQTAGNAYANYNHFDSLEKAKRYASPLLSGRIVRRAVGEWEEVVE